MPVHKCQARCSALQPTLIGHDGCVRTRPCKTALPLAPTTNHRFSDDAMGQALLSRRSCLCFQAYTPLVICRAGVGEPGDDEFTTPLPVITWPYVARPQGAWRLHVVRRCWSLYPQIEGSAPKKLKVDISNDPIMTTFVEEDIAREQRG